MYKLLCRPEGRPWSTPADWLEVDSETFKASDRCRAVQMSENRSSFGSEERRLLALLALAFTFIAVMSAWRGYWLVPVFAAIVQLGLLAILRHHTQSAPPSELLELRDSRIRHRDRHGLAVDLPRGSVRLSTIKRNPSELRLYLRDHASTAEIATCLSLEERRAIAPLIEAALSKTRRD